MCSPPLRNAGAAETVRTHDYFDRVIDGLSFWTMVGSVPHHTGTCIRFGGRLPDPGTTGVVVITTMPTRGRARDPGLPRQSKRSGIDEITLASLHAVRAGHHCTEPPVITAPMSALYRPVRHEALGPAIRWHGSWRTCPTRSTTRPPGSPSRIGVTAWLVLTHNSPSAGLPDVAVVNCFGDRTRTRCAHGGPRYNDMRHAGRGSRRGNISGGLLKHGPARHRPRRPCTTRQSGAWSPTATRPLSICVAPPANKPGPSTRRR